MRIHAVCNGSQGYHIQPRCQGCSLLGWSQGFPLLEKGEADDGKHGDQSKKVRYPKDTRISQSASHIGLNQFKESGRMRRCGSVDLGFFADNFQAVTMRHRVRIQKIRHAGDGSGTTGLRVLQILYGNKEASGAF